MQVQVSFRHNNVTDSLRQYAEDKVGRTRKLLIKPQGAQVTLSVEGHHRHHCEVVVSTANHTFVVAESSDDMYKSIDLVVDKLERQARRYKEKMTHAKGRTSIREVSSSGAFDAVS